MSAIELLSCLTVEARKAIEKDLVGTIALMEGVPVGIDQRDVEALAEVRAAIGALGDPTAIQGLFRTP